MWLSRRWCAEDVVASFGRNLLLRKMPGPGRVLEAAAAGLFILAKGIGGYLTKTSFWSEKLRKQHRHIQSLRGVSTVCSFEEISTSFWHNRNCARDMRSRGIHLTRCDFQFSRASTVRAEAVCTDISQLCVFLKQETALDFNARLREVLVVAQLQFPFGSTGKCQLGNHLAH